MEFKRLNKKVKAMWRLNRLLSFVFPTLIMLVIAILTDALWCYAATAIIGLIGLSVIIIYPIVEYLQWSYLITNEIIEIKKGIFFKTHSIIPVLRIHNVNTYQGPASRIFGLSTLSINTASGIFKIEGLEADKAEEIAQGLKGIVSKNNDEKFYSEEVKDGQK